MPSPYFCAILAPSLDLDVAILSPEGYLKINVLTTSFLFLEELNHASNETKSKGVSSCADPCL